MPKFRKKPVVIEAKQWFPGVDHPGVHRVMGSVGMYHFVVTENNARVPVKSGDWIIPEKTEGRFYPCDPKTFAANYQSLPEDYVDWQTS